VNNVINCTMAATNVFARVQQSFIHEHRQVFFSDGSKQSKLSTLSCDINKAFLPAIWSIKESNLVAALNDLKLSPSGIKLTYS